jgi:hypothetical protein
MTHNTDAATMGILLSAGLLEIVLGVTFHVLKNAPDRLISRNNSQRKE